MITTIKQRELREGVKMVQVKVPPTPKTHKELVDAIEAGITISTFDLQELLTTLVIRLTSSNANVWLSLLKVLVVLGVEASLAFTPRTN